MNDQKPIRVITEPGAFGAPALMVVIRTRKDDAAQVESFIIREGTDEEMMEKARELKKQAIARSDFLSVTILRFIEETRPLEEPDDEKIIRPNFEQVKHVHRSKYTPNDKNHDRN